MDPPFDALTSPAGALCAHCRLPLGRRPLKRRLHGESGQFCCYGCALAFQVTRGVHEEAEAARLLIRLGVGAFLAMNIMLLSLLLYSSSPWDEPALRQAVHYVLLALATPMLLILGLPFLQQAVAAGRAGHATIDTLISLGAVSAYGYSAWATLTGARHVYFDTMTMVLVLFTLGRYLEAAGRARAMRDLEPLLAPGRQQARVSEPEGESLRPVRDLAAGARVRVLPGERVPVDGHVIEGMSRVDESLMTGEAHPVAKGPGERVLAGSMNGTGPLLVEMEAAGEATRWAAIGRAVAESLRQPSPIQGLADRVATQFIYAVVALAVSVVVFWASQGPFDQALLIGLAVLVVACPCALGLAAPLATSVGVGVALRRGALVRSGAALERLATVRVMLLDKTGTLTAGAPTLRRCAALEGTDERELLRRAAALERGSEHALARGVLAAAHAARVPVTAASDVRATPGGGLCGRFEGEAIATGTRRYLECLGWKPSAAGLAHAATLARGGSTVTWVAWGERIRGLLAFSDQLRPEADEVVGALHRRGLHSVLLSGDRAEAVEAVATSIRVNAWRAACSPEDKRSAVEDLRRRHGPVAAVGDGINDGPLLAAADVGIAIGSATDLAQQAAEIVLPQGGLMRLPWLIELACTVRRTIAVNLAWAFGYNAVALALAAAGHLPPVIAAALMAGSSVLVVWNSLRLERLDRPFTAGMPPVRQATAAAERQPAVADILRD